MPKIIPKYGEYELIQFIGFRHLDVDEQEAVQKIAFENYQKIKRFLKQLSSLTIHVKVYGDLHKGKNAKDKRVEVPKNRKYSIHIKAVSVRHMFESSKAHDWDLVRALRMGFEDVRKQMQHKLQTDVTLSKKTRR